MKSAGLVLCVERCKQGSQGWLSAEWFGGILLSLIARCEHPEAGESCGSRMSGEITVSLAALLN